MIFLTMVLSHAFALAARKYDTRDHKILTTRPGLQLFFRSCHFRSRNENHYGPPVGRLCATVTSLEEISHLGAAGPVVATPYTFIIV